MNRELRTALIGMTTLALALGIGRFVLTPLLPLMQADDGLTLIAGGWLASTNMLGYLLGALLCALRPLPPRLSLRIGAIGVTLATLGMGLTTHLDIWLLWRFAAGIASAALVVHGIAWSMARLRAAGRPLLEHVVFSGTGVGIVGSGLLVAAVRPAGASSSGLWIVFGIVSVVLFAWTWRRLGEDGASAASNASASSRTALPSGPTWTLVAMYGLLGFAYTIPAAFLPLIAEHQLHLPALREWFWPLFGVAMTVSTLALRWLPARIDNRTVLAACSVSLATGMLLSVVGRGVATLVLATLLIGIATMPVVMYAMREARLLAPRNPVRLIAALTTTFGVGQAAGPAFAAWLAARTGGFDLPLIVGAAASVAAMACMLIRRSGSDARLSADAASSGANPDHPRLCERGL
ncbi:MAG TPA: YbfB/YjiJ family MFS transporter [Rhodanobacteraceae bacterium]|nr:YbfB/YjiJ family MFS transporter [Rhodanobacteraceae bacterium]